MFSEARKDTDASSDPLVADVMTNHAALLAAVQAQPACVSIVIGGPAPPVFVTDVVNGVTVYEHGTVPAAWCTETVWSAIVRSPLRAAPMLDATLNVTVPLPVPLVRPVSEIHGVSVLADQSHAAAAVTEIELPLVPVASTETSLGVTVTLQLTGSTGSGGVAALACCVIFTVWPATTIDAARVVVPEFDAIVKVTFPVPVPVDPPGSVTHAASA
jgi:hypothetical protein